MRGPREDAGDAGFQTQAKGGAERERPKRSPSQWQRLLQRNRTRRGGPREGKQAVLLQMQSSQFPPCYFIALTCHRHTAMESEI